MAGVNYSFAPSSAQPIDWLLTFSKSSLAQPHDDALVLTLEVGRHLMERILVDLSNAMDLLCPLTLIRLGYKSDNLHNSGRVLVWFNGMQIHSLGEIMLPLSTGPITTLVPLMVIDESLSFNAILGLTWIHAMKALLSSYHQRLSFLTLQGQVDINGD